MLIEFDKMEPVVMQNVMGGTGEMVARTYQDELTKIMFSTLKPGACLGEHTHTDSCEIIYVISGQGTVMDDGVPVHLTAGMCHYCPKGHKHQMINDSDGDLTVYAIVPKQ